METYKLVMPENLNHFGFLFGGYMLMWVDEIAWMAASLDYPAHRFVTIGMDHIEFRHGVRQGTILRFQTTRTRIGATSVNYLVEVFGASQNRSSDPKTPADGVSGEGHPGRMSPAPAPSFGPSDPIFSTTVTLVNVDESGRKKPV